MNSFFFTWETGAELSVDKDMALSSLGVVSLLREVLVGMPLLSRLEDILPWLDVMLISIMLVEGLASLELDRDSESAMFSVPIEDDNKKNREILMRKTSYFSKFREKENLTGKMYYEKKNVE